MRWLRTKKDCFGSPFLCGGWSLGSGLPLYEAIQQLGKLLRLLVQQVA